MGADGEITTGEIEELCEKNVKVIPRIDAT